MAQSVIGEGGVSVVPGSTQGLLPQWFGVYYGTVSSNADPLHVGRCQLRIPQVLGTSVSSWAWAMTSLSATAGTAAASVTPPAVGTVVAVMFLGGDLSQPAYMLLTTSATTITTPVTTGTGGSTSGSTAGGAGGTGTTGTAGGGGNPAITTASLPNGTSGTAYSQALAASGGTAPYTWSLASGSLPSWATLNSSTGLITGTPGTTGGTSTFTVKVTDASGVTASQALSITVGVSNLQPVGTPPGGPWVLAFADEFDVAYPTKYGTGPNPNLWADHFENGDMMRVNNSSEQQWGPHGYYGLAVANSILTMTAQFQNPRTIDPLCPTPLQSGGQTGTFTAPVVSSHLGFSFTYGYVEARIQQPSPPSSWCAFWMLSRGDTWPPEIDIAEWQPPGHTGQDQLGYFNMAQTWQSTYVSGDQNWHVWGCLLTSSTVTIYRDGSQYAQHSYDGHAFPWSILLDYAVQGASGGSGYPASYNIDYVRAWVNSGVPAQPAITSISPATGIPSGGNVAVSFGAVAGATSYRVSAAPTDALADGYGGNSFLSASGSASPITVSGLASGVRFNFTVCAINASGYSIESLPVGPQDVALNVTTTSLPAGTPGTPYSQTLAASGGTGSYTWSVTFGALPTWASLNAATGAITGTPATATGTTSFTVQVLDTAGTKATAALAITVASAGAAGPPSGGTGGTVSGPWTLVASDTFTSNDLATNFVVYNNSQATSYSANSWMASQVSIDTTAHALKSLAALSGGSGSPRVGGAWYWTGGSAGPAIMQYGAWEIDISTQPGAGYAPVVLMWPYPDDTVWPVNGEIDFLELYSSTTSSHTGGQVNVHLDTTAGSSRADHLNMPSTLDWSVQHTLRLEWQPSYVSVFVDGSQVATTTDTSYIPHTKPMRLTVQQEFYGVSDSSISALSSSTVVTGLRAYKFNG